MQEKANSYYLIHPVHSGDATADSRTLLKQPREIIKVAHCIAQIPLHSLFSRVPFPSSIILLFLFHPYRFAFRDVGPVARYHVIIVSITVFPQLDVLQPNVSTLQQYTYLYKNSKNKLLHYE